MSNHKIGHARRTKNAKYVAKLVTMADAGDEVFYQITNFVEMAIEGLKNQTIRSGRDNCAATHCIDRGVKVFGIVAHLFND